MFFIVLFMISTIRQNHGELADGNSRGLEEVPGGPAHLVT